MILTIVKEGAKNIVGTKPLKVGKVFMVTDFEYANRLINDGFAVKKDERFSFNEEIRKAKKADKNLKEI